MKYLLLLIAVPNFLLLCFLLKRLFMTPPSRTHS